MRVLLTLLLCGTAGSHAAAQSVNNDCANATPIAEGPQLLPYSIDPGDTSDGVIACGANNTDIWYSWSPNLDGNWGFLTCLTSSHDTVLSLYSACGAAPLACNDDACAPYSFLVALGLEDDETYLLSVADHGPAPAGGGSGEVDIVSPLPVNDEKTAPIVLTSGPQIVEYNANSATHDGYVYPGDCPSLDVWFEWSGDAPIADYTFTTCGGASHDTVISVWRTQLPGPFFLGCNDDFCGGFFNMQSYFNHHFGSGDPHLISVGESGAPQADQRGKLFITYDHAPANSDCEGALPITPGANPVSNADVNESGLMPSDLPPSVTTAAPDSACGSMTPDMNRDSFYKFIAPTSGTWNFSTCGAASAGFDTKLALYSGFCGALQPLACNDDAVGCSGFSSELRSNLCAGATYTIQLGGSELPDIGTATLTVFQEPDNVGVPYCVAAPNSQGAGGASMSATGSRCISDNDLVLSCGPIQPGQPGIFFYAPLQSANPSGIPFGEGKRCVVGTLVRILPPVVANGVGNLTYAVDNDHPVYGLSLLPGTSQNFQGWYRDPNCPGPGGPGDCNQDGVDSGFNLSNALTIYFLL